LGTVARWPALTGASIVHLYPGAEHGFTASTRRDKQVNAEAYEISWPQALEFIKATTRR
jgi:carboxymethylenebutenolidase